MKLRKGFKQVDRLKALQLSVALRVQNGLRSVLPNGKIMLVLHGIHGNLSRIMLLGEGLRSVWCDSGRFEIQASVAPEPSVQPLDI